MALVVIQAGHYPRKRGSTGTGGLDADPTEQEFTIAAAHACARALADVGHVAQVIWADVAPAAYAGDAFVAIHCDGSTNPSAHGASVGYRTSQGQAFGASWKRAYQAAGWRGGWRPDNYTPELAGYYGTKRAVEAGNRTAFIAEAGFLTNASDERQLSLPNGPERFAKALTVAVVEMFGGTDVPLTKNDQATIAAGVEDALRTGGRARDDVKAIVQGAVLDGLRKPDATHPDRGVLRSAVGDLVEERLRKVLSELAPSVGSDGC
jgi:hypothetical protein